MAGRGGRVRALGPPVALVAVAVLVVSPWTIRNARQLHHFVPVSTQLGSALAGTYNDDARTDKNHPASWRSLRHVASYQDLVGDLAHTDEAVLEQAAAPPRGALRARPPGYVADGRVLDDGARPRPRRPRLGEPHGADREHRPTWAMRGVRCFWVFALLALAGRVHPRRAAHAVVRLGVPGAHVPERRVPRDRDARYRTPLDPFIVMLAALAVVAAGRRVRRRVADAVARDAHGARAQPRGSSPRQLLLRRAGLSLPKALERIGGLQAQYAPSMYIGLWSRL